MTGTKVQFSQHFRHRLLFLVLFYEKAHNVNVFIYFETNEISVLEKEEEKKKRNKVQNTIFGLLMDVKIIKLNQKLALAMTFHLIENTVYSFKL